jgi:hypothetical protein
MTTYTRHALYPMTIGSPEHGASMHIMVIETARGTVHVNMAHFIRAEMSGNSLFLRFTDTPPIKVPGVDMNMFEIALKKFK